MKLETLLSEIQQAIEQLDYPYAETLIKSYKETMNYDEEIAVLEGELLISCGRPSDALPCIQKGLSYNSSNYELYLMLGEVYEMMSNTECAELCYRYSVYQCHNKEDLLILKKNLERFTQLFGTVLPKVSILLNISSDTDWLKSCLHFIASYTMPKSYEIIFLVSEIPDALKKWLEEQKIGKVVHYGSNHGGLYNLGIEAAERSSDILIIDEGGLPLEHCLFNLQLALYQSHSTGAAGSFSNSSAGHRYLNKACLTIPEAIDYAHRYNIPDSAHLVRTFSLPGPLYLFKREVIKQYGWFDSNYTLESYQKKDMFFRMLDHNKAVILCSNCFAAVTSEDSFLPDSDNINHFTEQWNVNLAYSCHLRDDLVNMICQVPNRVTEPALCVLEVGCACGSTLIEIGRLYPGSKLYGIESDEGSASIAKHFAIISNEDIENSSLKFPKNYFDYIIFGDVLEHLRDPKSVLHKIKKYLKTNGRILASIPNVMHISVVKPLLNGFWTYEDAGILDRSHIKFFTYKEILCLFQNEGYSIDNITPTTAHVTDEDMKLITRLAELQKVPEQWFLDYQYLVCAQKERE